MGKPGQKQSPSERRKISISKTYNHSWKYTEKLAAMKILDNNNMNHTKTAQDLGVSRGIIYKWKEKYWDMYLEKREEVKNNMITTEAAKLVIFEESTETLNKTRHLFDKIVLDYIENPEKIDKASDRDKVNLMNVIIPYILQKRDVSGVREDTPKQQNNFFTQILQQAKTNQNNIENGNSQD